MLGERVLLIDDGVCTVDEHDALRLGQLRHLGGIDEGTTDCLAALRPAALTAVALRVVFLEDGLLTAGIGDELAGGCRSLVGLAAAEVQDRIAAADDGIRRRLVIQLGKLRFRLQDDRHRDVSRPKDGDEAGDVGGQGQRTVLVEDEVDGAGELAVVLLQCLVAQDAHRLVDHHAVEEAERPLVGVVEDGEDGVLRVGVSEALEVHLVLADDELLHFRSGERCETRVAGDQDRFQSLAGCRLELAVVLC